MVEKVDGSSFSQEEYLEIIKNYLKNISHGIPVVHCTDIDFKGDFKGFYKDLTSFLGSPVRRNENYKNGDVVGVDDEWIKIVFNEDKKTESFIFSDLAQPLHTDGAYVDNSLDISFLHCLKQAEVGGATTFIEGQTLFDLMKKYKPILLDKITSHEVIFDKGSQQSKTEKIMKEVDGIIFLNWNYYRVSHKNSLFVIDMCHEFQKFLQEKIVLSGILHPIILKENEVVFFHDRRVLHGRNSFFGEREIIKGGISLKK